jgi:hypothetical protein
MRPPLPEKTYVLHDKFVIGVAIVSIGLSFGYVLSSHQDRDSPTDVRPVVENARSKQELALRSDIARLEGSLLSKDAELAALRSTYAATQIQQEAVKHRMRTALANFPVFKSDSYRVPFDELKALIGELDAVQVSATPTGTITWDIKF